VRDFSVTLMVAVADTANLTDPIWDNAEAAPDAAASRARRAHRPIISAAVRRTRAVRTVSTLATFMGNSSGDLAMLRA
jgi:hypothetical protein